MPFWYLRQKSVFYFGKNPFSPYRPETACAGCFPLPASSGRAYRGGCCEPRRFRDGTFPAQSLQYHLRLLIGRVCVFLHKEAVFTEKFHFGRLVPAKVAQSAISEENRGFRVGWENALFLIFAELLKIATFNGQIDVKSPQKREYILKVGSFRVLSYPQSNLEATFFCPKSGVHYRLL